MKKNITLVSFFIFLALPLSVYGQDIAGEINSFYNSALAIGGVLAVVMIVVGAIYFSVSGGSPDRKSEGKDFITSAIWGLILLLGAFLILNTVNPELTTLTQPSGPIASGSSCAANPDLDECGENQDQYDADGNLLCCTVFEGSSAEGAECEEEAFEGCSSEKIVVGGENPNTPYCESGTPICQVDTRGNQTIPYCNQGSGDSPGPQCDEGAARCNSDGRVYCTDPSGGGIQGGETIEVPDCSGDCSENITTMQIEIQPGGEYKQHPYFPENRTASEAQCVNYTYKKGPTYNYETANVSGMKYCR